MISTEMAATVARAESPSTNQPTKVAIAMEITTGTKTRLTRSARFWIGARDPCASRMSCTMRASALSLPSVVARAFRAPVPLIVPPTTRSPDRLATGMDSPVSMDSSTALLPDTTSPSAGMRSPGRTTNRSPGVSSSTGISASRRSRSTRTVLGWRSASDRSAAVVCRLARASNVLPSRMRPMMAATAS